MVKKLSWIKERQRIFNVALVNSGRGGATSIYTTTRQKSYKINT